MKNGAFQVLALASFLLAVGLSYGFVARCGPSFAYLLPATSGMVAARGFGLQTDRGRIEALLISGQGPLPAGTHLGLNFHWYHGILRWPMLGRSIWEFDAHPLPMAPGFSAFLIACPLWCLILPSWIAPTMWLRRRMRVRHQPQGFPVQQIAPA